MTVVTFYDDLGNVSGYWDEVAGKWVAPPAGEISDPLDEEEEETEE